jgi:hypothetical protein
MTYPFLPTIQNRLISQVVIMPVEVERIFQPNQILGEFESGFLEGIIEAQSLNITM